MIKHLYKTKKEQKTFKYTYEIGTTLDPLAREVIALVMKNPATQLKKLLNDVGLMGDLESFVERRFKMMFKDFTKNTTLQSYKNKDLIRRVYEEEAMIELEGESITIDVYEDLKVVNIGDKLIEMPKNLNNFVSEYLTNSNGVKRLKNVSETHSIAKIDHLNIEMSFEYNGKIIIDNSELNVPKSAYRQIERQMKGVAFALREFNENDVINEALRCELVTVENLKEIFASNSLYNGWKNNAENGIISISVEGYNFISYHLFVWNGIPLFYKKTMTEEQIIEAGYKEMILYSVSKKNKLVRFLSDSLIIELIDKYGQDNVTLINNIVSKKPEMLENMDIANRIKESKNLKKFKFVIDVENILRVLQKLPKDFKIMLMNALDKESILQINDQWLIKFLIENKLSNSLSPKQIKKYNAWSERQDDLLRKYHGAIRNITSSGIHKNIDILSAKELSKIKANKQFRKWLIRNVENPKGESFKRIIEPAAVSKARKCWEITHEWMRLVQEKENAKLEAKTEGSIQEE
ncbi:hypothetical protein MYMA111404_01395 [Mycoplasma marinum]|uniref:Uncharacterized protein n=1 Tax=Mycoplasma marinum TaxID=1937190 RepID=A0A4R0XWR5_9MOLU|nr:hypothetical protein [Mycoplasma marinum]TCG11421.1 hypothetical protein C4B24_01985 [Mycoplasma marinum]